MIASARSNAQLAETARQGIAILGPGTPAAARLENIARFLDFVGENITRAAEQAREVLYTKAEAISPSSAPTRGEGQGALSHDAPGGAVPGGGADDPGEEGVLPVRQA